MAVSMAALALGMWGLAEAHGWLLMWVYVLGVGVGFGLSFICSTVLLLRYFGRKANLELFSIMCLISTSAALGPAFGGWARDTLGSFTGMFVLVRPGRGRPAVATLFLRPPVMKIGRRPSREPRRMTLSQTLAKDAPETIEADLLIAGATVITMDGERRVIEDGAIAIAGDRIAAVGKRGDLAPTVRAKRTLEAGRFVATPGFVDAPHPHHRRSARPAASRAARPRTTGTRSCSAG